MYLKVGTFLSTRKTIESTSCSGENKELLGSYFQSHASFRKIISHPYVKRETYLFFRCKIFQNSKKMQYLQDVGTAMGCHGCFCIILRTTSICKHGIINRKQFEKQTAEIDMIRKKFYISTRPCNRSPKGIGHGPHIPIRALQNSILFHHHVNYNFTTLRTKLGTCHYLRPIN